MYSSRTFRINWIGTWELKYWKKMLSYSYSEVLPFQNMFCNINGRVTKCWCTQMQNFHVQIKTVSIQSFLLRLWPLENVMLKKKDFSQSLEKTNMPTQSCKCFLFLLIQRGFFSQYSTVIHKSYALTVKSFPTQFKRARFLQ